MELRRYPCKNVQVKVSFPLWLGSTRPAETLCPQSMSTTKVTHRVPHSAVRVAEENNA